MKKNRHTPTISVVIPAYNEAKNIAECLDSLKEQATPADEIIVVDNASTDNTGAIAKKHGAYVIRESKKGVGAARKAGFKAAQGDIIISTDADCTFPKNWIAKIKKHFVKNPHIVAVYGAPLFTYANPIKRHVVHRAYTAFLTINELLGKRGTGGSNFAIRASIYHLSPGFNKHLKMFEDIKLGQDLARLGKIVLDSTIIVYTSPRRLEKKPIQSVLMYAQTYFRVLWLGKDPNKEFEDIRD